MDSHNEVVSPHHYYGYCVVEEKINRKSTFRGLFCSDCTLLSLFTRCTMNHNLCEVFRLHPVHRCGLLLQMVHVAWSAYLSFWVCVLVTPRCAVQKRLNWSDRDAIGAEFCGSKEPCIIWSRDFSRELDLWPFQPKINEFSWRKSWGRRTSPQEFGVGTLMQIVPHILSCFKISIACATMH